MSIDVNADRKRVSVTFAGDDEVGKHITSLTARKSRTKQKKEAGPSDGDTSDSSGLEEQEVQEDEEEDSILGEDVFKPSQALAEDSGLTGDKVYGFTSLKRSGQMAQAASRAVEAVTPASPTRPARSSRTNTPNTPKSILKKTKGVKQILVETGQTPVTKRSSKRVKCLSALTPQRISARLTAGHNGSSSEESISSESSDEESDDSEASGGATVAPRGGTRGSGTPSKSTGTPCKSTGTPSKSTGTPSKSTGTPSRSRGTPAKSADTPVKPGKASDTPAKSTPSTKSTRGKGKKKADFDNTVKTDAVEEYFEVHSHSSVLTSDRTLNRLDTPRMDHQALARVLTHLPAQYSTERDTLLTEYRALYTQWMFLLCHGYNLVFHGLGSKRHLLDEFRTKMLSDFNHLVVNGYFPSLTIKNILNAITEEVMDHSGSFRTPIEQCDFIRKHYECGEQEDFYLVIHNIDGAMLRNEKTQTILSLLAQIRGCHIIASIDHINAPLMWDSTKVSRFNWLWYDVTTYDTYAEETSYEDCLLVQQSGALALSSLTHVMRSLTPNAKGIFLLLVKHQLEYGKDNSNYQGLSFTELYQKCREAFLVNSDLTLNTQLTEFKDHKLIRLKKAADGVEYLTVPLDDATLKEFLEQQSDDS